MRENEAAVIKALQSHGGDSSFDELLASTKQNGGAVARALTTLHEKQFVKITENDQTLLHLTEEGMNYAKMGLPERRLIQAVLELGGEATLEQAAKRANVPEPTGVGGIGMDQEIKLGRSHDPASENRLESGRDTRQDGS